MNVKTSLDQLALLGGTPAFDSPLHVGRPNIPDKADILRRVEEVLDRRWLTNDGPCVQQLEKRLADLAGVEHCVAICNGTVALEIAIRALELTGEVIVPAFTFVATAHALAWQGLTPVFADVDPETHTLDARDVERRLTKHTTGIIGVHLWGRTCDVAALTAVAERARVKLMFDAAHALCCTHGGKPVGGFGNAEVFSFHATKFFNTFEGGAIATNDAAVAERARSIRNFGFQGYDNVVEIGTNGKMNEVCAAMGLASFEALPAVVQANRHNYELYRQQLGGLPGLSLMQYPAGERTNYQYVVVLVDDARAGLTRDELVRFLHSENVLARRYFAPGVQRMPVYRDRYPHVSLPHTESLCERVMCLPTGTAVSSSEIELVSQLIALALNHSGAVRAALARAEQHG
jgi:dTDP-4-amino-4,6-dideoxygalactose transaminase